ncbi:MAG: hypothetical protein JNL10_10900 [Verrucomicrobiales bacterium]|nr:hypothetical protein [Verrucomicrobiales bacterium]
MAAILFLLVAGALLLLLEPIFPHFVAAAAGLVCWAAAVVLTYSRFGAQAGHWTLVAVLAAALAGTWWYLQRMPTTGIGRLVRSEQVTPAETAAKTHLLHARGITLTPLRPGGMAEFGGERVDVVSSGEPIEKGQPVSVISVDGSRILVRAA